MSEINMTEEPERALRERMTKLKGMAARGRGLTAEEVKRVVKFTLDALAVLTRLHSDELADARLGDGLPSFDTDRLLEAIAERDDDTCERLIMEAHDYYSQGPVLSLETHRRTIAARRLGDSRNA